MTALVAKPPIRSGFCNESSPAPMHLFCRKTNCPCPCGHPHWEPETAVAAVDAIFSSPAAPDLTPGRAAVLLEEQRVAPRAPFDLAVERVAIPVVPVVAGAGSPVADYVPVGRRTPRVTLQVTREGWYSRCRKCGSPIGAVQEVYVMLDSYYCTERCAVRDVPK